MSLQEPTEIGQRDTRRYAKRQFTWIANQMPDWPRVSEADLASRLAAVEALWR
jgi:tRNA dimethylallyltransferase